MRGCEEDAKLPVWKDNVNGIVTPMYRCPYAMLSNRTLVMMRFYHFYEKGFLPNEGGILNQANTFVSAMMILDEKIAAIVKRQRDEQEAKQKAAARKTRRGGGRKRWQRKR